MVAGVDVCTVGGCEWESVGVNVVVEFGCGVAVAVLAVLDPPGRQLVRLLIREYADMGGRVYQL